MCIKNLCTLQGILKICRIYYDVINKVSEFGLRTGIWFKIRNLVIENQNPNLEPNSATLHKIWRFFTGLYQISNLKPNSVFFRIWFEIQNLVIQLHIQISSARE